MQLILFIERTLTLDCQYHQRIYVLDTQVQHLRDEALIGLGEWLGRKARLAAARGVDAQTVLSRLGFTEEELREGWAEQLKEQTKPLPR